MNIGFDAKRAYHNSTGLGQYSRTLIRSLSKYYNENEYYLFNPKPASSYELRATNIHEIQPADVFSKLFPSAWRGSWVKKDLKKLNIDLYHGLSHELPAGIRQTGIKSVVTIHDLIHERFPKQYSPIDVRIYSRKFRYACAHADKIIAISEQTKKDIIEIYKTPEEKIVVCYQSCNPAFEKTVSEKDKAKIKERYNLPEAFFLYVGSITERKNLLTICKAMLPLKNEVDVPLIVIGEGGAYKQRVKDFVLQNGLENRVIFLSERLAAKAKTFQDSTDFPAIFQSAVAMIYPSIFEGFGIPVLEALWSRLPVITSNLSSLPEAGGEGAYYINPYSAEEMAEAMKRILFNKTERAARIEAGWQHAQNFTQQKCAAAVMDVYGSIV